MKALEKLSVTEQYDLQMAIIRENTVMTKQEQEEQDDVVMDLLYKTINDYNTVPLEPAKPSQEDTTVGTSP